MKDKSMSKESIENTAQIALQGHNYSEIVTDLINSMILKKIDQLDKEYTNRHLPKFGSQLPDFIDFKSPFNGEEIINHVVRVASHFDTNYFHSTYVKDLNRTYYKKDKIDYIKDISLHLLEHKKTAWSESRFMNLNESQHPTCITFSCLRTTQHREVFDDLIKALNEDKL